MASMTDVRPEPLKNHPNLQIKDLIFV